MTNLLDLDPPAHIRIHDTALAAIVRDLAAVPPERGAALFGKNPVVTLTVPDTAGRYSPVSWDISSELSRTVQELEGAGLGEFMGTVHSHPAGLPVPSGGDLLSTMNLLDHNPKLNSVIVAIVTEGIPDQFNHVPVGRRHRMSIQLVGRQNGRAVAFPFQALWFRYPTCSPLSVETRAPDASRYTNGYKHRICTLDVSPSSSITRRCQDSFRKYPRAATVIPDIFRSH